MNPGIGLRSERRDALEAGLGRDDLDAGLVTSAPDVRYLCGFSGSSGALLLPRSGPAVLITDFRYEEQAAAEVDEDVRLFIGGDGWIAAVETLADELSLSRIGFDPEHLTVADHRRLEKRVDRAEWIASGVDVAKARAVKEPWEIERIETAVRTAERALERLIALVDWDARPTERQIAARLDGELREAGSASPPFETIVATGARTSLPHAAPSGARIESGDLVLVDFGARVDGYCSDLTRTFTIGPATDWQREVHARVLEAQSAAIEAVAAGARAADVDAAVRSSLREHELDRFFGHSTGHGLGLEVHENPRLSSRSEDVLEAGNVVTVEPGVYLPGRGGVRIEDDVAVTESGARVLSRISRDLIEL